MGFTAQDRAARRRVQTIQTYVSVTYGWQLTKCSRIFPDSLLPHSNRKINTKTCHTWPCQLSIQFRFCFSVWKLNLQCCISHYPAFNIMLFVQWKWIIKCNKALLNWIIVINESFIILHCTSCSIVVILQCMTVILTFKKRNDINNVRNPWHITVGNKHSTIWV